MLSHDLQHGLCVHERLVVPKSQDLIALRLEPACPMRIVGNVCGVLASVNFNDQFFSQANEINDRRAHGMFPTELMAVQLFLTQVVPKNVLRL